MSNQVNSNQPPAWYHSFLAERKNDAPKKTHNLVQDITDGTASAFAAMGFVMPLVHFKSVAQENARKKAVEKKQMVSKNSKDRFRGGFPLFRSSVQRNVAQKEGEKKKKISRNPRDWYRGGFPFLLSFAPLTVFQTVTSHAFSNYFSPMIASILSGIASSPFITAAEAVKRQSEITKLPFFKTAEKMHASKGITVFFRGTIENAVREGGFSGTTFGATPLLKEQLEVAGYSPVTAHFLAGASAGTIGAFFTHPFDTYKTQLQSDLEMQASFKGVFQKTAFAGFGWRWLMFMGASTMISYTQDTIKNFRAKN